MAWTRVGVDEVEYVAAALIAAGQKLRRVAESMREAKLLHMYLQLKSAHAYADSCRKLSADAELHFDNQLHCMKHGGVPLWQLRQQKSAYNKALAESKSQVESLGNVKKPAKKATKRKP